MYFDLMKVIPRGGFGQHYDSIDAYYDDSHLACRDLEIVATSKDSGYGTEGGTFAIRNFLHEKMLARFVG